MVVTDTSLQLEQQKNMLTFCTVFKFNLVIHTRQCIFTLNYTNLVIRMQNVYHIAIKSL